MKIEDKTRNKKGKSNMASKTLTFKRIINAPPSAAFRAFTNSSALREWLCDTATTDPHKGGRFYVAWGSGYYAGGEYTALAANKKAAFTWRGKGDPDATKVQVSVAEKNGGSIVKLAHTGVGSGKAWAKTAQAITRGWERWLDNLRSTLETGEDLRLTLRPMLGITGDAFDPDVAKELGVPVTEGARLGSTLEGMGAHAAGLRQNDVLVSVGGKKVRDFGALGYVLQNFRAGDSVPVVFYRGGDKKTVTMTLSKRPLPEIPATAMELAAAVRKIYDELDAELGKCFEGVTEAEASFKPGPKEWSAKDVVAHLMSGERDGHSFITEVIGGHERYFDDYAGNVEARHAGIFAAYPTARAMFDEYKRNETETVAMLAALPPEFVARRSSYWRIAFNLLQPPFHTRDHFDQMRAAIEAARKK